MTRTQSRSARNRAAGLALAAVVFGLDQWLKWVMIGPLQLRSVGQIYVLPFFQFTYTENPGVSLGLLPASSEEMRWILVGVTALIALVVLVWMMRERAMADIAALGLILGGALGNIRDRSVLGYVIDFLDLHFGEFRPFYIFNIADAAITIGVLLVLARSLFLREKRGARNEAPIQDEPVRDKPDAAAETN